MGGRPGEGGVRPLSRSALRLLQVVAGASDDGVWWHDMAHPERAALLRRGLIRSRDEGPPCVTHGYDCPCYVEVTPAGIEALK
jgi:hypothetical protein